MRAREARGLQLHQRDESVHLRTRRAPARRGSRPSRRASSHSAGRIQIVAGRRGVALVEDEVDHLEHRRQPLARAPRRAAPRTARCASASVRLARTIRWAIVGSGTRNARAISSVVSPPSSRSVSATRASRGQHGMAGDEHQAQQVVADGGRPARRRDRGRGRCVPDVGLVAQLRPACAREFARRRNWSMARRFAVAMSQAPGLSGMPVSGHFSSAMTSASCARSSAIRRRAPCGPARR